MSAPIDVKSPAGARPADDEVCSLRDLSPEQWKSGVAAWLGWLFDGLDMHLYTLVALPFVAQLLLITDTRDERVGWYSSLIQGAFLLGWALGVKWTPLSRPKNGDPSLLAHRALVAPIPP